MNEPQDKLALLQEWMECYLRIKAVYDGMVASLGCDPNSPIVRAMFDGHTLATKLLCLRLKDADDMLSWFIYDNDCGARKLGAKAASWSKTRPICNLKDLLAFIEAE